MRLHRPDPGLQPPDSLDLVVFAALGLRLVKCEASEFSCATSPFLQRWHVPEYKEDAPFVREPLAIIG